ncbi:hypothetical protein GGI20_002865 [Coemansia sp. BCRC 34301]|nr:hypothetical protein GGI20_002865 [Coemansia sp. BCRC 34301]
MDNDSFESFINQSLVDTTATAATTTTTTEVGPEIDNVGLENELLLQLLLNAVTPTTIDPSELTTGDSTTLPPSTIFSTLDTLPLAAAPPQPLPPAKKTIRRLPQTPVPSSSVKRAANPRLPHPPPSTNTRAAPITSGLASPAADEFDDFDMADEDMAGIDVKSLSSKERRQLRNKISARNFRVRRKEYISNLEAEVRMHKEEADGLRAELAISRKDNLLLRDEVNKLRQRLGAVSVSSASGAPTRPPSAPIATQAQAQQQQPPKAGAQPLSRFNPHKDIGQASPKKDGNWAAKNGRSGFITVNTATVPAAHAERLEGLVADVQRRRAVEALLSIGDDIAAPASMDMRATFMALAALVADCVMSQVALESSFALAHGPSSSSANMAC